MPVDLGTIQSSSEDHLFAVCADQHRHLPLVRVQRVRDSKTFIPKWKMYTTLPSQKLQGSLHMKAYKECKSQRWWVSTMKQCLLDIAGQLHVWTHSGCHSMHKTCESSRQKKFQHREGCCMWSSTHIQGVLGNYLLWEICVAKLPWDWLGSWTFEWQSPH